MKRDKYYFPHDSDAKDDHKMILLIEDFGLEGYGIFWVLIESLRQAENYILPVRLIPGIARRYNTSIDKIKNVIEKYDLFVVDQNMNFYSKSLLDRMEVYEKKVEINRLAGIASAAKRALNVGSTSKVKESKVKEKKVKKNKERTTVAPVIFFNGDILKIPVNVHDKFLSVYPRIPIEEEYKKMDAWILCHPEKKYKNFSAFANNWLSREIPETVATEERNLNVTQRSVLESRRRRLAIEDNGQKELTNGN